MSDVIDLRFLSGQVASLDREMRLVRLQVDQIASVLNQVSLRMVSMDQNFHGLVSEVSKGFGQSQQQQSRNESRFDALDAGLTELRTEVASGNAKSAVILTEIRASKT